MDGPSDFFSRTLHLVSNSRAPEISKQTRLVFDELVDLSLECVLADLVLQRRVLADESGIKIAIRPVIGFSQSLKRRNHVDTLSSLRARSLECLGSTLPSHVVAGIASDLALKR